MKKLSFLSRYPKQLKWKMPGVNTQNNNNLLNFKQIWKMIPRLKKRRNLPKKRKRGKKVKRLQMKSWMNLNNSNPKDLWKKMTTNRVNQRNRQRETIQIKARNLKGQSLKREILRQ